MAVMASCSDDPDGKWDEMEWKATSSIEKADGHYMVNPDGGTYTFQCTNYAGFWFSQAVAKTGSTVANYYPQSNTSDDGMTLETSWAHFTSQGNLLIVTIEPNYDNDSREVSLTVTTGDIFDTFRFCQNPKE